MKSLFAHMLAGGLLVAMTGYADMQVTGSVGAGSGSASAASANLGGESTPAASPDDATESASTKANACVPACYNTPDAKPGCDVSQVCKTLDGQNGNYFAGVDKACGLAAGTAIKMAHVESTCNPGAANGKHVGLFQFSRLKNICPYSAAQRQSLNVQKTCLCNYVADTRARFMKATGKQPSAGIYYMFHQQGPCALKLITAGAVNAVKALAACQETDIGTAHKRIASNLPEGYNASTITAEQFSNLYMSKFNGIDNSNVCSGGTLDTLLETASTDVMAQALKLANGDTTLAEALVRSMTTTADGSMLSTDFVKAILADQLANFFDNLGSGDDEEDSDTSSDSSSDSSDGTLTIQVIANDDGTKKVTVTKNATTTTYMVALGYKLWNCDGSFSRVATGSSKDQAKEADTSCKLVAEGTEEDAK